MSKTNDIGLSLRDGIGGFYELMFYNDKHDYWKSKAKQNQSLFSKGASIKLTEGLTHLKTRFGDQTNNFIYFFCPFINTNAQSAEFEIQFILNKNPVTLEDKSTLDQEVFNNNSGQITSGTSSGSNDISTILTRARDIITEVKGDGNISGIKKRMEESPGKYYEVLERNIKVDLWDQTSKTDVKKVEVLFF